MTALAQFKDLCIDAGAPGELGPWWGGVLGREWHAQSDGDGYLTGATPQHTIWINGVPEAKSVKHRVHLDIYVRTLEKLTSAGAIIVAPEGDRRWTVMTDPEGGEFCAFLRSDRPAEGVHGLVVDSVDPTAIATWWGEVFGVGLVPGQTGWATLEGIPGLPIQTMDFVPVPEPKTIKNRIHWDVTGPSDDLLAHGATLLRRHDDEIRWDVLADPEGNEFCVFARP